MRPIAVGLLLGGLMLATPLAWSLLDTKKSNFPFSNLKLIYANLSNSHQIDETAYGRLELASISYRFSNVETRQILDTVQATGNVRPVALVSVSSELSGQIREYRADFNDEVRRGDLLAVIDPVLFEIAVDQSEAQVGMARSNVLKAEVALREAEAEFQRREVLASRGSGSQAEMGTAEAKRDLAMAQLEDASYAQRLAEAGLRKAIRDLERTRIHSPVDGTVIQRNIEVGQTVTVGYDAPVLYTIAQDLREMQVNVSIPESEIGRIRGGQRVEFTVDAYAGRSFDGEVLQVRMQPQNTQNVVTYTVIVTAPNPDLLLLPGMTATANVIVNETDTTLAVPTAALRFRLPDEPRGGQSRVLVERDGDVVAIPVRLGATDGSYTAIEAEGLQAGDSVITGLAGGASQGVAQDSRRLLGIF
jgi:HlyD family secretion protein